MPPDKKAKLNAKKKENYDRKKAEKQSIVLKHTVRFIIGWINLFLVGEGHIICSYIFMTLMRPLRIGSRGLLSLILQ